MCFAFKGMQLFAIFLEPALCRLSTHRRGGPDRDGFFNLKLAIKIARTVIVGGAATRHLIDADVLDALGPDGFIVNVARGSVVDEAALVRALAERRIAGAGLDVFENEPQVPAELMALDNVVLLPHIASGTRETRQAMADRVFDNLQNFFAGRAMPSPAPLS